VAPLDATVPNISRHNSVLPLSSDEAVSFRPVMRAQQGSHQPKVYTDSTVRYDKYAFITNTDEPMSVDEAIRDKNWKVTMNLEFDALMKNKTWHMVPPMKGKNIVGCK
jgi:hypothetical protein